MVGQYVVYYFCCTEHGEPEINYYDTLEEAEKLATSGDYIFKVIKEAK